MKMKTESYRQGTQDVIINFRYYFNTMIYQNIIQELF